MPTKKTQATANTQKALTQSTVRHTPWMGTMPVFDPDGPPKDWERQHAAPRGRTILGVPTWNQGARPVPRQASCHFYQVRSGNSTFYFI